MATSWVEQHFSNLYNTDSLRVDKTSLLYNEDRFSNSASLLLRVAALNGRHGGGGPARRCPIASLRVPHPVTQLPPWRKPAGDSSALRGEYFQSLWWKWKLCLHPWTVILPWVSLSPSGFYPVGGQGESFPSKRSSFPQNNLASHPINSVLFVT